MQDQRAAKRFKLEKTGILYDVKVNRHPIELIDVSSTGMKISGIELGIGQEVIVEWCETDIHSVVVWSSDIESGLSFKDYLDPSHPLLELAAPMLK